MNWGNHIIKRREVLIINLQARLNINKTLNPDIFYTADEIAFWGWIVYLHIVQSAMEHDP